MGVLTIDADSLGHIVLEPDGPAFGEVSARWPQVLSDGRIDRQQLGAIVFHDPDELGQLEAITHPHIFRLIGQRAGAVEGGVVVEMPLLGRKPGPEWKLMVVDAVDELRVERAVARGMSEADVEARMASQPSREEWLAAADAVVPNHGSVDDLKSAVERLLPHL
jgi:dephospho-CoA kinase